MAARKDPARQPVPTLRVAITIDATAEELWRWLVQLGKDRGGLYSYDWLENLASLDVHSAEEIVAELQDLKVGDLVRLAPESMGAEAGWRVAVMEPGRTLMPTSPPTPKLGARSTATTLTSRTTTAGTGRSSWRSQMGGARAC